MYQPNIPSANETFLKERWLHDEQYRTFLRGISMLLVGGSFEQMLNFLSHNSDVIPGKLDGNELMFIDLRGIPLGHLEIKTPDLSYCCFDYATFNDITFHNNSLQFATFKNALLYDVEFFDVKANPVDMTGASLTNVYVKNSNFTESCFLNCKKEMVRAEGLTPPWL